MPSGSPSSRGRGLKHYVLHRHDAELRVALFARAWIETSSRGRGTSPPEVALFARAWIETRPREASRADALRSPSSRGRGLKHRNLRTIPAWQGSPSSRGRGLKRKRDAVMLGERLSPSSRGRGLKHGRTSHGLHQARVALFARAWIETRSSWKSWTTPTVALFARAWIETWNGRGSPRRPSRPLREGVD